MENDVININGVDYVKKAGVSKTMKIMELKKEIPFKQGLSYFFRTVTYHMVGRVKEVVGDFIMLEDASWVADSGRFMNAIKEGVLDEVEPVGIAFVHLSAIVDAFPWVHKLPSKQK